jgi:hypothetical protein
VGQVGNLRPGPEGAPRTRPLDPSASPPTTAKPVRSKTPPPPVSPVSSLRPVCNRPPLPSTRSPNAHSPGRAPSPAPSPTRESPAIAPHPRLPPPAAVCLASRLLK